MNLRQLQRLFAIGARDLGDASAARRGPEVLACRVARREGTRLAFRLLRQIR